MTLEVARCRGVATGGDRSAAVHCARRRARHSVPARRARLAIRHGQLAALGPPSSARLRSTLFIPPRHRLAIAHSRDLVELIVLLIAAVVVGGSPRPGARAPPRRRAARRRGALASARRSCSRRPRPRSSAAGRHAQLKTIGSGSPPRRAPSRARVGARAGARARRRGAGGPVPLRARGRVDVRDRRRVWERAGPRADLRAARAPARRRARARPRGRKCRRGRGGAARGSRPHGDPPRALARPALAADRDHDGRLGAAARSR